MSTPPVIRIGRRVPYRPILVSIGIAAVLILGFGAQALTSTHPENAPILLLFLLLPVVVAATMIPLNQYAEIDPTTWLVRVNGAEPRPLADLTHCTVNEFRGARTLTIGYSDRRRDRFTVSSHTPFGSPRVERDWIRYLLPYTGLPRDPTSRLSEALGTAYDRHATLEQAQTFAHEWLK